MNTTIEIFPADRAFEITMLHNVRWASINWWEKSNYNRDPNATHIPCLPQDKILDVTNPDPIIPVSGGGVIAFDTSDKVLMALVLKRGMLRWELPAGVAKDGESLEETARREALEETGKYIEIDDVAAMCWHYSRKLNKGWMGLIFQGKSLADENLANEFLAINPRTFSPGKFNIYNNPELYHSIDFANYNFDDLLCFCQTNLQSTAHESVVAAGFIDWKRIPVGRIHPLHLQLLQAYKNGDQSIEFLSSDADRDIECYDEQTRLYYKN
jgi:NUDIX domain